MTESPPEEITGCQWPVDTSCACENEWLAASEAERSLAADRASSWLWAATGRRLGLCEVTVRPCGLPCSCTGWDCHLDSGPVWYPYIDGGMWYNATRCSACRCQVPSEVALPGPVESIVEVQIDGQTVDPATYRVDDFKFLVRTGGRWPDSPDLTATQGWTVTYLRGIPVPDGGAQVTGELACEFLKACQSGTQDACRLPEGVQRVIREGVQMTISPDTESGLPAVDAWVASVNPAGSTRPPVVVSPDSTLARTVTDA